MRKHMSKTFFFCFHDIYPAYCTAVCTLNLSGSVLIARVTNRVLRHPHPFLRTEVKVKVKLSSQWRWVAEVWPHVFLISALDGGESSVALPPGKEPSIQGVGGWVGHRAGLDILKTNFSWKLTEHSWGWNYCAVSFRKNEPKVVWFPPRIFRRVRSVTKSDF